MPVRTSVTLAAVAVVDLMILLLLPVVVVAAGRMVATTRLPLLPLLVDGVLRRLPLLPDGRFTPDRLVREATSCSQIATPMEGRAPASQLMALMTGI